MLLSDNQIISIKNVVIAGETLFLKLMMITERILNVMKLLIDAASTMRSGYRKKVQVDFIDKYFYYNNIFY